MRAAALRAAAALHFEAGASRQAQDEIDESVRLYERIGDDKGLADALQAQGNLFMAAGRLLEAKQVLLRAAELAGPSNAPTRIGALGNLALIAHREERVDEARVLLEQVQREAEAAGDLFSVGMSTGNLMALYKDEGRKDEAVAAGRQSVDAFRRLGDRADLSWALANFSGVLMTVGDLAGAEETLREGIILAVETGAVWNLTGLLLSWASLEETRGEFVAAVRWTAVAKKVRDEAGEVIPPNEERDFDAAVARLREAMSADAFAAAWATGESEEPIAAARSLVLG